MKTIASKKSAFRSLSLLLLLIVAVLPSSAAGSRLHNYIFNVGQFDHLSVLDDVNVVYRCNPDSTGYVAYRGEKDFADAFIINNSGGKLKIQVTTEDVGKPGLPTIYVYSDFLNYVENSGNFSVEVFSPAPTSKFTAKVVGNGTLMVENIRSTTTDASITAGMGKITLSGSSAFAKFRITGTGSINAEMLKCTHVKCVRALGTGYIGCWPTELLEIRGIGSTKIFYKGDPEIKGHGNAVKLPEEPNPASDSDEEEEPEPEDTPSPNPHD